VEIYELLKAPVSPEVRYLGDQCGNRYFPNSKSARVKTRQSLVVISYLLSVGGLGAGSSPRRVRPNGGQGAGVGRLKMGEVEMTKHPLTLRNGVAGE